MSNAIQTLPDDVAALKTALLEVTARAEQVEAELANARARASDDQATIAHQQLQIAKLQHQLYGQKSERAVRLLDQLALGFEEWGWEPLHRVLIAVGRWPGFRQLEAWTGCNAPIDLMRAAATG